MGIVNDVIGTEKYQDIVTVTNTLGSYLSWSLFSQMHDNNS